MDELPDHQRLLLSLYPPPQLFAVVSWGCAATSWLARVLNSHPDIYSVHAANHSWHVLGGSPRLDGVPYLRVIGSQGHAHLAAGCVHGVSRHLIPECRQYFGKLFNAAVVVREPLPRLQSQLALFKHFEGVQAWDVEYLTDLLNRTGVKLVSDDYRSRLFVHAANMLNAILEEHAAGRIYRCEDLTQTPDVLGDFIEQITCGKVSTDSAWLRSAIGIKRINVHRQQPDARGFSDWQIDVLRKVVDPRSWDFYEAIGYRRPAFLA